MSPSETSSLTRSSGRPRSTNRSFISGSFFRSSSVMICIALLPMHPIRSSVAVWTITRCAISVFGSNPPRGWRRKNPVSFSMKLTMNPISSIWAATNTTGPSPFLWAIRFPNGSILTVST